MFNKYYQDELSYLRAMGREFAGAHPQLAPMLAEAGTDPDVERLLEGFAFLTGRIRQRLDSELPELTHALVDLLWPHYLRPVPAMSILQFEAAATLQETQIIKRGTSIESAPVEGTRCRFRTTADVRLYPFRISDVKLDVPLSKAASLTVTFAVGEQVNMSGLDLGPLRLFLHGDAQPVGLLYLWLCRHVQSVTLQSGSQSASLPVSAVVPAGFDDAEALLPYPSESFAAYRLLQEFFALPERYHFIDIVDLRPLAQMESVRDFSFVVTFDENPPGELRIGRDMIRAGCTPIVNLQGMRSAPVTVDHERTEYRLRADASDPDHFEVFSVDKVLGWTKGTLKEREYKRFFSFSHVPGTEGADGDPYYNVRLRPASVGAGTDVYLSFVAESESGVMPPTETVAADLTCTNRNLPAKLHPGEINVPTSQSPAFATFNNITRVTPSVAPPLEGRLLWHLVAHQSLNYLSLADVNSLRAMLGMYNFPALSDRQAARTGRQRLEGITRVKAAPDDMIRHGAAHRGIAVDLEMDEESFAGEGDMYLFASVLNRFFGQYATINAFTRLSVRGTRQGAIYQWPAMLGSRPLL
ncbi:MAG TPA: type VI secretion system baseplate subunit TssF [candidate division Zixibacteria bacterium]|jgi:type VI secretion system protein ImpG